MANTGGVGGGTTRRATVCAVCWHASNHRSSPQLTKDGPDSRNKCKRCGQAWKTVSLVFSSRAKQWIEIRPRPSGVNSAFKLCEYARRRNSAKCPARNRCTFAHSQEELADWHQGRDAAAPTTSRIRKPDAARSGLCRNMVSGKCQVEGCTSPHQFQRCPKRFNGSGSCPKDALCPYAHSDRELQAWNNWLARTPNAMAKPRTPSSSGQSPVAKSPPDSTFWCADCELSFSSGRNLQEHFKTGPHIQTVKRRARERQQQRSSQSTAQFRDAPRNVFGDYRMCRFIASNRRCDFGAAACTFAHSEGELAFWRSQRQPPAGAGSGQHGKQSARHRRSSGGSGTGDSVSTSPSGSSGVGSAPSAASAAMPGKHPRHSNGNTGGASNAATAKLLQAIQSGQLPTDVLKPNPEEGMVTFATSTPPSVAMDTVQSVTWRLRFQAKAHHELKRIFLLNPCLHYFRIVRVKTRTNDLMFEGSAIVVDAQETLAGPDDWCEVSVEVRDPPPGTFRQALVFECADSFSCGVMLVSTATAEVTGTLHRLSIQAVRAWEDIRQREQASWAEIGVTPFPHHLDPLDSQSAYPMPEQLREATSRRVPDLLKLIGAANGSACASNATPQQPQQQGGTSAESMMRSRLHALCFVDEFLRTQKMQGVTVVDPRVDILSHVSARGTNVTSRAGETFLCLSSSARLELSLTMPMGTIVAGDHVQILEDSQWETTTVVLGRVAVRTHEVLAIRVQQGAAQALANTRLQLRFSPSRAHHVAAHRAIDAVPREALIPTPPASQPPPTSPTSPGRSGLFDAALVADQAQAVHRAVAMAAGTLVIKGPRGSGKTRTAVEIIKQALAKGHRVLVCATSCQQADWTAAHLRQSISVDCPLLRFKNPSSPAVPATASGVPTNYTPDGRYAPASTELLHAYACVVIAAEDAAALLDAAPPETQLFNLLVVDSSGLMDAPTMAIVRVASHCTRAVLCGNDPQTCTTQAGQLARACGLKGSHFEQLCSDPNLGPLVVALRHSFTLNTALTTFLYPGAQAVTAQENMSGLDSFPLAFTGVFGDIMQSGTLRSNDGEAAEAVKQMRLLFERWPSTFEHRDVAVVAMCPLQAKKIRALLSSRGLSDVTVMLRDEALRRQFRAVILSTTSEGRAKPVSTRDIHAMFAVASSYLMVVGNPLALSCGKNGAVWKAFIALCRDKGTFNFKFGRNLEEQVQAYGQFASTVQRALPALKHPVLSDLPTKPAPPAAPQGAEAGSVQLVTVTNPTPPRPILSKSFPDEYRLSLGGSNPWGSTTDDASSLGGSDIARSWSSIGSMFPHIPPSPELQGRDATNHNTLSVPSSPGSVSSQDEKLRKFGQLRGDIPEFVPQSPTLSGLSPSLDHSPSFQPGSPWGDPGPSSAIQASAAHDQQHRMASQHLHRLVQELAPAGAREITERLLGSCKSISELMFLLRRKDVLNRKVQDLLGGGGVGGVGGGYHSLGPEAGLDKSFPDFLEAQSTSLLEHSGFCKQELRNGHGLSGQAREMLERQLQIIEQQWMLLNQQRQLHAQLEGVDGGIGSRMPGNALPALGDLRPPSPQPQQPAGFGLDAFAKSASSSLGDSSISHESLSSSQPYGSAPSPVWGPARTAHSFSADASQAQVYRHGFFPDRAQPYSGNTGADGLPRMPSVDGSYASSSNPASPRMGPSQPFHPSYPPQQHQHHHPYPNQQQQQQQQQQYQGYPGSPPAGGYPPQDQRW